MTGPQSPIDLGGAPALVLCFDPLLEGPGLVGAGDVVLVADQDVVVPGCTPVARFPLSSFVPWRRIPEIEAIRPEHVIVHTLRGARPLQLLAAMRHGARWFHLVRDVNWGFQANRRGALALGSAWRALALGRPSLALAEELLGLRLLTPWRDSGATVDATRLAVQRESCRPPAPRGPGPLRILHYVGALHAGGAERQLTYLAMATRARGSEVQVLTMNPLVGEGEHYLPDLQRAGVPCRWAGNPRRFRRPRLWDLAGAPLEPELQDLLDRHLARSNLIPLIEALQEVRPDVLHCWLDEPNLIGALAGLAVGVPRILISTRNVHPGHFPHIDRPWFRDCYRALAGSRRVVWVANSRAGAESYAEWIGIPSASFQVVRNGFDPTGLRPCPPEQRAARRVAAGLDPEAWLVMGVFRLSPEKRPGDFLSVAEALARRAPRLQVAHVGSGVDEGWVRAEIQRRGLGERVKLLGRRGDAQELISLADATLLCSEQEGCPNVSLESQALGVPVVLTCAGGAAETVDDGRTGFVCPIGAVEELAGRLLRLQEEPQLRAAMSRAGPMWVAARFGLAEMVAGHERLYRAG